MLRQTDNDLKHQTCGVVKLDPEWSRLSGLSLKEVLDYYVERWLGANAKLTRAGKRSDVQNLKDFIASRSLTVLDLQADLIQDFYRFERERGQSDGSVMRASATIKDLVSKLK